MEIALISCSKEKKNHLCPAWELYSASALFSLSYQYAKQRTDKIYILSAKYGLVTEEQILEPYNQTLREMTRQERLDWASRVLGDLQRMCDIASDHFVILAGSNYYKDLITFLPHYELPLARLRMGERMAFLKKQIEPACKSMCLRLHELFSTIPRYTWGQIPEIPFTNGIYIIFEKGEQYYGMDRIVRVGTHISSDRLKNRLADHFVKENHDGSIFRKNIGKAILNADCDPYLHIWTLDTSKPENRKYLDNKKNADTEKRVSKYMRENFTFVVFWVDDNKKRLRLEEAIIAAVNQEPTFGPSAHWLGNHSPENEIRESGLWLKQGLDGRVLSESEYVDLLALCNTQSVYPTKIQAPEKTSVRKFSLGKYAPLHQYLKEHGETRISLSFDEIETILGFSLPHSAYTYPVWWNPGGTHTHCQSWVQAGYKAVDIRSGIRAKRMTFEKAIL